MKLQFAEGKQIHPPTNRDTVWATMLAPFIFSGLLFAQSVSAPTGSDSQGCEDLARAHHGSWFVISAKFVHPPLSLGSGSTAMTVSDTSCRVSGRAKPVAGSDIEFELWLPPPRRVGTGNSLVLAAEDPSASLSIGRYRDSSLADTRRSQLIADIIVNIAMT